MSPSVSTPLWTVMLIPTEKVSRDYNSDLGKNGAHLAIFLWHIDSGWLK